MFKAIGRYLRAAGYFFTGRIDKARQALESDPNVILATYDQVIDTKRGRTNDVKAAVAQIMHQQEKKKLEIQDLRKQVQRHKELMSGALIVTKKHI